MHLKKVIILLFSIIIVEVLLLGNRYKITAYRDVCNQGKSKTNYIIIVDTTTNSLSVFKEGKLFKTYKCRFCFFICHFYSIYYRFKSNQPRIKK